MCMCFGENERASYNKLVTDLLRVLCSLNMTYGQEQNIIPMRNLVERDGDVRPLGFVKAVDWHKRTAIVNHRSHHTMAIVDVYIPT